MLVVGFFKFYLLVSCYPWVLLPLSFDLHCVFFFLAIYCRADRAPLLLPFCTSCREGGPCPLVPSIFWVVQGGEVRNPGPEPGGIYLHGSWLP